MVFDDKNLEGLLGIQVCLLVVFGLNGIFEVFEMKVGFDIVLET